jgi:DNA-binding response OmpR family regulator
MRMERDARTVLVVDDEPKILEAVAAYLENKGYRVLTAEGGAEALALFARENVALVILDLMMPGMSGEEVCLSIRRQSRVPVVMLTAKAGEENLVRGLKLGADDYIAKPFSLRELAARAEAILRRTDDGLHPLAPRNSWGDGDLAVDFERNLVFKKGAPVALTPSEMRILASLVKYPGKVFTRAELVEFALGEDFDGFERTVDSHMRNLRRKIEDDPKSPVYVLTVHGLGYKFGGM